MSKGNTKRKREPVYVGKYLEINPRVCGGKLIFRGTRVPVQVVLAYMAEGLTVDEAMKGWPTVSREAILEALSLAKDAFLRKYEGKTKQAA
jgi:uncharacterized protein (DUF433 family)